MYPRLWQSVRAGLVLAGLTHFQVVPLLGRTDPTQPSITVSQKMPESIEPGTPLSIEITVGNTGPSPAEAQTVTDLLPANYDLLEVAPVAENAQGTLTWRLGRVGPGESRSLRLKLGPRSADVPVAPQNVVDVTFEGRAHNVCVSKLRAPELELKVNAPPASFTGQQVACRMQIVNKGLAPAQNVTLQTLLSEGLSNPMGADLESNLGSLAPGESRVVDLDLTPMRPGEQKARVTVQAVGAAPVTQIVSIHAEANPLILAIAAPKALQNQLMGLFEFTVHNDGLEPVRNVVLTAVVPEGLEFTGASEGGTYDAHTRVIRWELGELRATEERCLAWNGAARTDGDLKGSVRLSLGTRTAREQSWVTRVVSSAASRSGNTTARATKD